MIFFFFSKYIDKFDQIFSVFLINEVGRPFILLLRFRMVPNNEQVYQLTAHDLKNLFDSIIERVDIAVHIENSEFRNSVIDVIAKNRYDIDDQKVPSSKETKRTITNNLSAYRNKEELIVGVKNPYQKDIKI